jgi:hypothetical protein
MRILLISFIVVVCFVSAVFLAAWSDTTAEDFKAVKWGRKDLIRNDLIKSVVLENSNLCKSFINEMNWNNRNCEKSLEILRAENDELERELKELKGKRK